MKSVTYIMIIFLACLVYAKASASELNWGFKSPAFHHGNGYSAHVLSVEQLQHNRRQDIKDEQARIKKIFKFENPKTLRVRRSLLFLILTINHILATKIIKGRSFIIILGTNMLVSISGKNKFTVSFLKNSISSNKFKIIPNA